MAYEKSFFFFLIGSVLGPKEEEGTGGARKFLNEKMSVDQTKCTA